MERNALKLFGVQDLVLEAAELKRQLLLYDQIYFDPSQVEGLAESLRGVTIYAEWGDPRSRLRPDEVSRRVDESLQTIEYLKAEGVLFGFAMADELPRILSRPEQFIDLLRGAYLSRLRREPPLDLAEDWLHLANNALFDRDVAQALIHPRVDLNARAMRDPGLDFALRSITHATLTRGIAARRGLTALFESMAEAHFDWAGRILGHSESDTSALLASVVLSAFPMPDQRASFEDILRFRDQDLSRELYARLRDWLSEIPSAKKPQQLAESIQNGLVQYQAHMKRQNMSFIVRRLKLIFATFARAWTGLLRPSDGVEVVSSIVDADAQILAAEAKAPRKEIAYIARASEAFDSAR